MVSSSQIRSPVSQMSLDNPKYDVAISFLAKDEPIAAAIDLKLRESLDVFFFPNKQKDLAGTDGMESMRTPFLKDCRVMVVLYREPWGKTRWTAIEETAIKEACFNEGWKRLFFISLDRTSRLPDWLPEFLVRLNWEDFGLEQAVGAIKTRVLENGGRPAPLTPLKKAQLLKVAENLDFERSKVGTSEGIRKVFDKVIELFQEIQRHCEEINAQGTMEIDCRSSITPGDVYQTCALRRDRIGMAVMWRQQERTSLNNSALIVQEFIGGLPAPGQSVHIEAPEILDEKRYAALVSYTFEYGWTHSDVNSFVSSMTLAEQLVSQFIDLVGRANSGELDSHFFDRSGWNRKY